SPDEEGPDDDGLSSVARILKKAHEEAKQKTDQPAGDIHSDGVYELNRDVPAPDAKPAPSSKPSATTTCPDCGGTVSKRAESCPHCGAPLQAKEHAPARAAPTPAQAPADKEKPKTSVMTWVVGFFIVVIVVGMFSDDNGSSGGASSGCGPSSPACYAERLKLQAGRDCKPRIEAFAKYSVEWDDNWLDGPFERYRVSDDGSIHFMGSLVRFQNGFGAWSKMDYSCTWHPETGVIFANVS
ncbi:MAG: hypothetical protein ABF296_08175, partial [Oceanococcaceae bacterium]